MLEHLFVMAQHIVRVKFGIIFPSNGGRHESTMQSLKAFGSRSYSDETSRHVGYKAAALAQRSDEPPAKKSKMALEAIPFCIPGEKPSSAEK